MLPGKKFGVSEILEAVKRRVWLLVIPPAVTFFAALLYSSTLPDVYQSDMLITIDPQRVPGLGEQTDRLIHAAAQGPDVTFGRCGQLRQSRSRHLALVDLEQGEGAGNDER